MNNPVASMFYYSQPISRRSRAMEFMFAVRYFNLNKEYCDHLLTLVYNQRPKYEHLDAERLVDCLQILSRGMTDVLLLKDSTWAQDEKLYLNWEMEKNMAVDVHIPFLKNC
jgi:hypothetical protein